MPEKKERKSQDKQQGGKKSQPEQRREHDKEVGLAGRDVIRRLLGERV